ncbi:hypothetical protein FHS85_003899 [Rhodoligotrophos appendicifer]|uniref:hypothetical protein n=1 Tax=Rhodoligotrophos appendicifer TaxID=987056 RepID=UPI001186E998|nr:hypothetical protein [Rhodoligotrophos appendicifer]
MRRSFIAVVVVCGGLLHGTGTFAQVSATAGGIERSQDIPQDRELIAIIRGTVTAFDQANRTGNYTVFRQLASNPFQDENSVEKLSSIFKEWRTGGFNLSSLAALDPIMTRKPMVDRRGLLRLAGTYKTSSGALTFDLAFAADPERGWVLFGLTMTTDIQDPSYRDKRQAASGKQLIRIPDLPIPANPSRRN